MSQMSTAGKRRGAAPSGPITRTRLRGPTSPAAAAGPSVARNAFVKSIAIYNYKGGVGKTTTTRELAAALVKLGHRVGVMDVDAQCNITTYFADPDDEDSAIQHNGQGEGGEEDVAVEPDGEEGAAAPHTPVGAGGPVKQYRLQEEATAPALLEQLFLARQDNVCQDNEVVVKNIYDVLQPVFVGGGTESFNRTPLPLKRIPGPPSAAGELWLLPGSARVVEYEKKFESAADMHMPYWLGIFRSLINKMAREKQLDYVLLDCSPSSGVINKLAVMSCDYILPPAMPDLGNVSSLHGMLTYVLPAWLEYRETRMAPILGGQDVHTDFKLPAHPPRLLPVMVVNFSWRTRSFGTAGQEKEPAVIAKPSQWIRTLRALMTLDDRIPNVDPATRTKMRKMMLPEVLTHPDGSQETFMVWALINKLESAMSVSAEVRWPLSWMAEAADCAAKESALHTRVGGNKLQSRWRKDARIMLDIMTSVCHFLDKLPASPVPPLQAAGVA